MEACKILPTSVVNRRTKESITMCAKDKESQQKSLRPESNQWPMDNSGLHTTTVHRSTNWATERVDAYNTTV